MGHFNPIEAAIEQTASDQNGNVTRAQLVALGLTNKAIVNRVRTGRLFHVYRNVYAVGRPPRTPLEWATAAVLACSPGAGLAGLAALAAWGLMKPWPFPPFDVIVPRDVRITGINTHRLRGLTHDDIRRTLNTHVLSPAVALLDTATTLDTKSRARAVNDARIKSLIRLDTLAETLDRFPRHPGRKLLLPFIERGSGATDSPLEDDMLPFFVRYGFPLPESNVHVAGHRVDFLFPDEKVIIECDGWSTHNSRDSFENDRDRDADTLEAEHVTVRITKHRIRTEPDREAERLHNILRSRRPGRR